MIPTTCKGYRSNTCKTPRESEGKWIQHTALRYYLQKAMRSIRVESLFGPLGPAGTSGDFVSMKAPRECSKKFVATFKWKPLIRRNAPYLFLFLEVWSSSAETVPPLEIFSCWGLHVRVALGIRVGGGEGCGQELDSIRERAGSSCNPTPKLRPE